MSRGAAMADFLKAAGWGAARVEVLAGDASARRYWRLWRGTESAVLMDADPATGEATGPFLAVGGWLLAQGYSAPRILAADEAAGFLLLEDLGDDTFGAVLMRAPEREGVLIGATVGLLGDLHRKGPPPFLKAGDGAALGVLVGLLAETYCAGSEKARALPGLIAALFDQLAFLPPVVSLRDFHAGNLIWLPDRIGPARIGLLDFQDAFVTDRAYDLVSLLQDARRDTGPGVEAEAIRLYLGQTGVDGGRFGAIYALIGAQRALRILAVFARLAQAGKPQYLDLMPRVWGHLTRNLAHPALASLRRAVEDSVPEPTPERRAKWGAA